MPVVKRPISLSCSLHLSPSVFSARLERGSGQSKLQSVAALSAAHLAGGHFRPSVSLRHLRSMCGTLYKSWGLVTSH